MTIQHYIDCCKAYAASGATNASHPYSFVLAEESYEGSYIISCDCSELIGSGGSYGPDIRWAAGLTPEEIERYAPQEFINALLDEFQQGIDEGWDNEQLQATHDRYSPTGVWTKSDQADKDRAEEKAMCRREAEYDSLCEQWQD